MRAAHVLTLVSFAAVLRRRLQRESEESSAEREREACWSESSFAESISERCCSAQRDMRLTAHACHPVSMSVREADLFRVAAEAAVARKYKNRLVSTAPVLVSYLSSSQLHSSIAIFGRTAADAQAEQERVAERERQGIPGTGKREEEAGAKASLRKRKRACGDGECRHDSSSFLTTSLFTSQHHFSASRRQ